MEFQDLWLRLFKHRDDTLSSEKLKELISDVEKQSKRLDEKKNIPAGLSSYLKGKMNLVCEEIKAKTDGKKPSKEEQIKAFIQEMRLTIELGESLKKVNAKSIKVEIPRQAVSETKRMFSILKDYPIDDRLSAGGLERKEYKDLVILLMSVLPGIATFEVSKPSIAQPAYGIRRDPILPTIPTSPRVTDVKGELSVKQTNAVEQQLKPDMQLYLTSVLDNAKDENAKITFSNSMTVDVKKKEILTGMELAPEYKMDAKLEDEIKNLIKDLGHEDPEKRDKATAGLGKIGPICRKYVEEALAKTTDPEVKARAEAILKEIKTKEGGNPIVDNLIPTPQYKK